MSALAFPKTKPVRSEAYRRLVAALPCAACGAVGRSQAAHDNAGRGKGQKSDDRTCHPLCGPHLGARYPLAGCHAGVDSGRQYTRERRRELQAKWAAETRAQIRASGQWPKNLPEWEEPAGES